MIVHQDQNYTNSEIANLLRGAHQFARKALLQIRQSLNGYNVERLKELLLSPLGLIDDYCKRREIQFSIYNRIKKDRKKTVMNK